MSFYYLGNSRNDEQLAEMIRLERQSKCLFCSDELGADPVNRVLARTDSWIITENRYPYQGAKLHLLLVPVQHVTDIVDLPEDALMDFWAALKWIKASFRLDFYGLGIRCGDCRFTGGTIRHVHVHVVVGDVADPGHEPVRLKLSSRPPGA